jgi:hypothetical protein
MTRYQKLGVLSIRWMAIGLFTTTAIWVLLVFAGARAMSGMMGQPGGGGSYGMMGTGLLWGPIAVTLLVGGLLYALARPLGSAIGSGLED